MCNPVTTAHPDVLHGKGYDDARTADGDWPDVHGGLTFAEPDTDCGKGGEDSAWWLGFDCAHAYDYQPGYARLHESFRTNMDETYRDVHYVMGQCRSLARQLASSSV